MLLWISWLPISTPFTREDWGTRWPESLDPVILWPRVWLLSQARTPAPPGSGEEAPRPQCQCP